MSSLNPRLNGSRQLHRLVEKVAKFCGTAENKMLHRLVEKVAKSRGTAENKTQESFPFLRFGSRNNHANIITSHIT